MTKEVEVLIKGFQKYDTHEDHDLETKTKGEYYFRNGCHYVLYEEKTEGFTQTTKTMLKLRKDCIEMTRKGLVHTEMVFDKRKETMSRYKTPYGEFLLGIDTKELKITETDNWLHAEVEYALETDGRHMADCKIHIQICARTY